MSFWRNIIFITCFVLFGFVENPVAEDKPPAPESPTLTKEDKELVEVIEILKLMELLQDMDDMDMIKELHLFAEEKTNEKDD
jgi:hypothetical protein